MTCDEFKTAISQDPAKATAEERWAVTMHAIQCQACAFLLDSAAKQVSLTPEREAELDKLVRDGGQEGKAQ